MTLPKKSIITSISPSFSTPVNVPDPNITWRVDDFNELIYSQGYDAYLDRAMKCPCAEKSGGQALTTCKNCLGRGWFFVDRRSTKVVSQSMNNSKKFQDWGETNRGIAKITARGSDKMGFMDRIILLELEAFHTEILRPISFGDEIIAYPIYEPEQITNFFMFVSDTEKLMPVPSEMYQVIGNRIVFDQSLAEYIVSDDMNSKLPLMSMTIRYSYRPVFHVIDSNRELMRVRAKESYFSEEKLKDMPINVTCRKAHYIFDAQKFGQELIDNTVKP